MRRLLAETGMGPPAKLGEGDDHVLVLDAPDGNGLAAMAVVSIEKPSAHLRTLVIDRRYEHGGLEQRILGVAEALSVALGASHFDISQVRNVA